MRTTGKGFEQNIPLLLFIQRSGVPAIEICRDLISRKGLVPARCVGTAVLEDYPCTVVSDLEFENRTDLMVKYKIDSESFGFTREQLMSADFVTSNISGASAIADALFALRPVTIVQAHDSTKELIASLVAGGMTESMATATVEHEETLMESIVCSLAVTCWGHTIEEISDTIIKYHEYRRDTFVKRLSPPVPKPEVQEVNVRYPRLSIVGKFFIAILIALFAIAQLLMISCLTDLAGRLGEIQRDLNNMEVKYYGLVEDLESILDASIDEPGHYGRPKIVPNSENSGSGQNSVDSSSTYQAKPYFAYQEAMPPFGVYDEYSGYSEYARHNGHNEYSDFGNFEDFADCDEWCTGRMYECPVTAEWERSGESIVPSTKINPASEFNSSIEFENNVGGTVEGEDVNAGEDSMKSVTGNEGIRRDSTQGSVVSNSTARSTDPDRAASTKGGGDR